MSRPELFFDTSALVAGIGSRTGGARALLDFSETGLITVLVSEQVIAETERTVARKLPAYVSLARELIRTANVRIVKDPGPAQLLAYESYVAHATDLPILFAAMQAGVDFLVTLNRRQFIDDPAVAQKSKLRIGTPGDALAWLRTQIGQ